MLVLIHQVKINQEKKIKKGGEGGIRTHGTLRYTRSPSVRVKPDYATSPQTAI